MALYTFLFLSFLLFHVSVWCESQMKSERDLWKYIYFFGYYSKAQDLFIKEQQTVYTYLHITKSSTSHIL